MHVVLARHGNTFEANERPVWVGARSDLPLVAKGREQAIRIGEALRGVGLTPRRALAGPLKRTRETAHLALVAAGIEGTNVETEPQLREIDYGDWEGMSSDEIRSMGGAEELKAWEESNAWPSRAGWPSSSADYVRGFFGVLEQVGRAGVGPVLIVSSNGIFKLFASSLSDGIGARKMGTGHMSLLRLDGSKIELLCWDLPPAAFREWTAASLA